MGLEKRSVAIIGAGVSGLAACKHLLERGCRPVVFEAGDAVGGVWPSAMEGTRLQAPRHMYRYSDFPWPDSVTEMFPNQRQVADYLHAYARRFDVLDCVRLGHRVTGMEYVGVAEEEVAAWDEWAGCGEAFGSGDGEWRLTVADAEGHIEVHTVDFVILCTGRFSNCPNIPKFPPGRGPEAFDGKVIHSMDYSKMGSEKAKEMIKDKCVTVVGYGNSALDIANECANINGMEKPCTMVVRTKQWIIPNFYAWGINISNFYLTRFAELLIHKPGEGFLLSILATVLTPLRLMISKFAESYYSIPMKKHGMVPDHSFFEGMVGCMLSTTPKDHYKNLEEGIIVIKKSKTFGFCKEGVLVEGESTLVKSDIVIFGTGFNGDQNIKDMFISKYFHTIVVGSTSTATPLYRECIHPKIPQLAVIGYSDNYANVYTSELRSKWLAYFMDGGFRLPSVKAMQRDVLECEKVMKRYSREESRTPCIGLLPTWYNDRLCEDMGCNPRRKNGFFAELFESYGPDDYNDLHPK
ncbi:probable flavin-containing monooxygenase 1 isoform X1 [Aegilops tauschii subsp. strangulata]|uniref:Flavin-containing monooxygenase n=3 Tax=Aegilops tauschii subsp. strangulata TaxID=200361 RepID=A0A453TBV3_AEGTS|nr:probable flavin-containing monooxygenase 1 isoform X1 [Aegilops tauschii subsp. strangulata]